MPRARQALGLPHLEAFGLALLANVWTAPLALAGALAEPPRPLAAEAARFDQVPQTEAAAVRKPVRSGPGTGGAGRHDQLERFRPKTPEETLPGHGGGGGAGGGSGGSASAIATIAGTVCFNDRREHWLLAVRRDADGDPGERCDPDGERDDGRDCSVNWLGAQYMVVDVIEIDEGFFGPTAWNCKKEDIVASAAVDYRGQFSVAIPVEDGCKSDNFSNMRVKLSVRTRRCGADWCFSMRDGKGDVYALLHPGASEASPLTVRAGADLDVGRMNFNPGGMDAAVANDTQIAANYYASDVDAVLMLHSDGEIPFYKDEFGEVEFLYPSSKSLTATALAPTRWRSRLISRARPASRASTGCRAVRRCTNTATS